MPASGGDLAVLLYVAEVGGSTAVLDFARCNPALSRLLVAGPSAPALEEAAQALGEGVPTHLLPRAGVEALADACETLEADLVVMAPPEGTHWLSRGPDWRYLERLPAPVIWTRGECRPLRRILLASGGDDHTLVDAQVAARLAAPLRAEVTLLHVLSQVPVTYHGLHGDEEALEPLQDPQSEVGRTLEYARDLLAECGIPARIEFAEGLVVETILQTLGEGGYDLLVIGAHSSSGLLDRFLLENVTRDLASAVQIPVLVARIRTHGGGGRESSSDVDH